MQLLTRAGKIDGFLVAVKTGNLLKVKKYLSIGVDVEARSKTGWNGLHFACGNGHLNIVQYLIESCHADKEAKDFNGCTPLYIACRHGNLNIVHYLIDICKVDKEAKDYFFESTVLQIACRNGHISIVQYLIEQCYVNKDAKDNEGWTALHYACEKGQLVIVQYLLESCRFNPHTKTYHGLSAYDLAEKNHKSDVMQYLKDTAHFYTRSKDEPPVRTAGTIKPKRAQVGTASNAVLDIAEDRNIGDFLKDLKQVEVDKSVENGIEEVHQSSPRTVVTTLETEVATNHWWDGESYTVIAPAGPLGIVIHNADDGAPTIFKVKDTSPLYGKVNECDRLVNLENIDLSSFKPSDVQLLLEERSNKERILTFLRAEKAASETAIQNATTNGDITLDQLNKNNSNNTVTSESHDSSTSVHSIGEELLQPVKGLLALEKPQVQLLSLKNSSENLDCADIVLSSPAEASLHAYELSRTLISKLLDDNKSILDAISQLVNTHQIIYKNRGILDSILLEKCNTLAEQEEQSAILSSPQHRDFYILIQAKSKCMIKACETLSTGLVGFENGGLRSFIVRTIHQKKWDVLLETKIGLFIGKAVEWATKNLAVVPFIDTIGSVFHILVTLKDERDRYLGLARVVDFATHVSLHQNKSLDSTIERFARLIVRARCGLPTCKFVEDKEAFGKLKQLMIHLLVDSDTTPAMEQASKASDCAFAHIMKPNKNSILEKILNGKTNDVGLAEALAVSVLGLKTVDEIRELPVFTSESQSLVNTGTPSTSNVHVPRVRSSVKHFLGKLIPHISREHAESTASTDVDVKRKILQMEREIEDLKKKIETPTHHYIDVGGGLIQAYANAHKGENDENRLEYLCDKVMEIDNRITIHAEYIEDYGRNDLPYNETNPRQKILYKRKQNVKKECTMMRDDIDKIMKQGKETNDTFWIRNEDDEEDFV